MNLPAHLDAETAAWLRTQMTIAACRAIEPVAEQLRATEEFAFGLLRVLGDMLPTMLEHDPELAASIAPQWQQAADRFEQLERGEAVPAGEAIDRLEARGQLYRLCAMKKVWPAAASQRPSTKQKRA